MDKTKRPINLDLTTINFPPAAIVSILHRVSGIILFFFIPLALWMLEESLRSPHTYQALQQHLGSPLIKFILWGFLSALLYHLLAGVRHILMDLQIGETLEGSRNSAYITVGLWLILIILAGIWLW